MSFFTRFCFAFYCLFASTFIWAQNYQYELRKKEHHVLHILSLHPKHYRIELVKAHDEVRKRETVLSIAKRKHATIAINGGFFEMNTPEDGAPSGTLVIHGTLFGLLQKPQACLILDDKQQTLQIEQLTPKLRLNIGKLWYQPSRVNRIPKGRQMVLYTPVWGDYALTPSNGRREFTVDKHHTVKLVSSHGNTPVPKDGFLLSLGRHPQIVLPPLGSLVEFTTHPQHLLDPHTSMLMGIPLLMHKGAIPPALLEKQSSFYTEAHARTAIGLRPNGELVIVVAEHAQKLSLGNIAATKPESQILGLSIKELASLMQELGCQEALNLDGGGSSTLVVKGKILNQIFGDKDEWGDSFSARAVSDAIVFIENDASLDASH